jgi:pentose-5-phosphate-3-epimerase
VAGLYDFVQVMGIERVGSQGQPFDARAIDLVARIRAMYPALPLQVDGAAATHPQELARAGADRLIVGSAIITAADPAAALREIYNRANGSER